MHFFSMLVTQYSIPMHKKRPDMTKMALHIRSKEGNKPQNFMQVFKSFKSCHYEKSQNDIFKNFNFRFGHGEFLRPRLPFLFLF